MTVGDFILRIGSRHKAVYGSLKDARDAHNCLRDASGKGASSWPQSTITHGRVKMCVSYNGRVWGKNGSEIAVE